MAYLVSSTQTAQGFAQPALTSRTMPVLAICGEKFLWDVLGQTDEVGGFGC